jgi:hypothetical protein
MRSTLSRCYMRFEPVENGAENGISAGQRSALGGTRTPNLLIRSQMLYPLSYERWVPPKQPVQHTGRVARAGRQSDPGVDQPLTTRRS